MKRDTPHERKVRPTNGNLSLGNTNLFSVLTPESSIEPEANNQVTPLKW
jgi:hypothetical protein